MTGVAIRVASVALMTLALSMMSHGSGTAQTPPDATEVLSIDHYVTVESIAPSMEGEVAQIYVRERAVPATVFRSFDLEGRVVLFVHGGGTPPRSRSTFHTRDTAGWNTTRRPVSMPSRST